MLLDSAASLSRTREMPRGVAVASIAKLPSSSDDPRASESTAGRHVKAPWSPPASCSPTAAAAASCARVAATQHIFLAATAEDAPSLAPCRRVDDSGVRGKQPRRLEKRRAACTLRQRANSVALQRSLKASTGPATHMPSSLGALACAVGVADALRPHREDPLNPVSSLPPGGELCQRCLARPALGVGRPRQPCGGLR